MKDNEEILITANEALRKELEELKTQQRPLHPARLSYILLMGVTVIGTVLMVLTTKDIGPVFFAVLLIGWLSERLKPDTPANKTGIRINLDYNSRYNTTYEVEEKPKEHVRESRAKRDA